MGISKMEFFNFSSNERVKQNQKRLKTIQKLLNHFSSNSNKSQTFFWFFTQNLAFLPHGNCCKGPNTNILFLLLLLRLLLLLLLLLLSVFYFHSYHESGFLSHSQIKVIRLFTPVKKNLFTHTCIFILYILYILYYIYNSIYKYIIYNNILYNILYIIIYYIIFYIYFIYIYIYNIYIYIYIIYIYIYLYIYVYICIYMYTSLYNGSIQVKPECSI